MYIKRQYLKKEYHYLLSESYRDQGCWKHRVLMDLGTDPGKLIEYPGGRGFYINESVVDRLRHIDAEYSYDELEDLFIPFLRPEIRRIVKRFQGVCIDDPGLQPVLLLENPRSSHGLGQLGAIGDYGDDLVF